MSTLYLVATPIGNLEDITLRALRILREVSVIAAEDTRTTGRLLKHYNIETRLMSYHEHNEVVRTEEILARLKQGDVALVSDAGMPGLSDPGYRLVAAASEAGVMVSPIPGAAAAVAALVASGLPTDSFLFLGFLPRQEGARRAALGSVSALPYTLVLYEAPHRLLALLRDIQVVLGDRPLVVARELTKLHEEIWRGTPGTAHEHFSQGSVRGEITVVVGGSPEQRDQKMDTTAVRAALKEQLSRGIRRKTAVAIVAAQAGWRKRDVYALSLEMDADNSV